LLLQCAPFFEKYMPRCVHFSPSLFQNPGIDHGANQLAHALAPRRGHNVT